MLRCSLSVVSRHLIPCSVYLFGSGAPVSTDSTCPNIFKSKILFSFIVTATLESLLLLYPFIPESYIHTTMDMHNSQDLAKLEAEADDDILFRTAEIAVNAPRYRRKSSTFIDGIHDVTEDQKMAPAQLYSTMSGRLFHSGRIAIVMVGPPARGKT